MILLDAFALVALLRGERASAMVHDLIRTGDAAISSINLAEVIDQIVRVDGVPERELHQLVDGLIAGGLTVVHTTDATPWTAARLRARHYRRRGAALSLAHCVLLASAGHADAIATADRPVIAAAEAEGIDVLVLSVSRGRTP